MTYHAIYFSLRFLNWCKKSRYSPIQRYSFLSLHVHCTSKPSQTQVDSLPDKGNLEYALPVSLLDDLCLDLCPCTTEQAGCCDIAHVQKYPMSHEKSHASNLIGSTRAHTPHRVMVSHGYTYTCSCEHVYVQHLKGGRQP